MMKRVLSAVLSSAMAVFAFSPVSASSAALSFGDPNGDEKTDAKDASVILAYYAYLPTNSLLIRHRSNASSLLSLQRSAFCQFSSFASGEASSHF